jgi:hypothetical protein
MSNILRILIKNKICLHNIKSAHVNNMIINLHYIKTTKETLYQPNINPDNKSHLTYMPYVNILTIDEHICIPTNIYNVSTDMYILKKCVSINAY